MDSGASCTCDSSDMGTDPTQYLEALKKKYLDRTAKLQSQQMELERKIMHMEAFLGNSNKSPIASDLSKCSCDNNEIPKIFPETPVRDIPAPKILADINPEKPVVQQCSFFQKMMENARSILSIKCQCASAFVSAKSTSITPNNATSSELTTEPPTKETAPNTSQIAVAEDPTLTDKSSKTSICSCDDTDPSTLQEASCSCHIEGPLKATTPQEQQVSIDPSSTTPKESQDITTTNKTTGDSSALASRYGKNCPFKDSTTKDSTSGDLTTSCSCEVCMCTSSITDDRILDLDNIPPDTFTTVPKVSVFSDKPDNNQNAEVQATKPVESRGINFNVTKNTVSKCVTCCSNKSCPSNRIKNDFGNTLSAGIQAVSTTHNKGVNNVVPKNTSNAAVACCRSKSCPSNQPKNPCRAKCSYPLDRPTGEPRSDPYTEACREKCDATRQDGENQCAFVGSPLLNPLDFEITGTPVESNTSSSKFKVPCDCNTPDGPKKICQTSIFSLTSDNIIEMQNIAELAKKEKQMKAQIEELQKRERAYQEVTRNMETLVTKTTNPCCCCQNTNNSPNMNDQIQKISTELRLENQMLKSELMDMKIELKHCLEKVEGPMKQKLQLEKQKCESLQLKLQDASKNMLLSQDSYSREMNQLKLQLCCACTNITELNQMNARLKEEMAQLDCLCAKLEDDLVKQKINEADTIKRLTNRRFSGDGPPQKHSEEFRCDSNLDVIARKLSKTLKELAPCEECSKLPIELSNAAKCIKDLTDMVRKRKMKSSSTTGCNCSSKSSKGPSKSFSEEECCSCCKSSRDEGEAKETSKPRKKSTKRTHSCGCDCAYQSKQVSRAPSKHFSDNECSCSGAPKDGGGEPTKKMRSSDEKAVKTLLSVPENFVQKEASSKFDVGEVESSYHSSKGEPLKESLVIPCANIGRPCFVSKATLTKTEALSKGTLPCSNIGEPCQLGEKSKPDVSIVKPRVDKSCRAPCSEIMKPVRDEGVDTTFPIRDEKVSERIEKKEIISRASTTSSTKKDIASITYEIIEKIPEPLKEGPEEIAAIAESGSSQTATGELTSGPPSDTIEIDKVAEESDESHYKEIADIDKLPQDERKYKGDIGMSEDKDDKAEKPEISHSKEEIQEIPPEDIEHRAEPEMLEELVELDEDESDKSRELEEDEKSEIKKDIEDYQEQEQYIEQEEYEEPTEVKDDDYGIIEDQIRRKPSKDEPPAADTTIQREIPFEEERFGEFPVDVANKAFALDEPSADLHVTTTITGSGTLEVITKGPGGTIETTLTYTDEGNIEVVTEMVDMPDEKLTPEQALEKFATEPTSKVPCEPGETCHSMEKLPGTEECDPSKVCHDFEVAGGKQKLKAVFPVESSKISGPSGPEAETPYTTSFLSGEGELTSNLGSESSGIKKEMIGLTPDLTSVEPTFAQSVKPKDTESPLPEGPSKIQSEVIEEKEPTDLMYDSRSGMEEIKSAGLGATTPSAQDALRQDIEVRGAETLPSEGITTTGEDMQSGDVFTPDQALSDEEQGILEEIEPQIIATKVSRLGETRPGTRVPLKQTELDEEKRLFNSVSQRDTTGDSIEFGEVQEGDEVTVLKVRNSLVPEQETTELIPEDKKLEELSTTKEGSEDMMVKASGEEVPEALLEKPSEERPSSETEAAATGKDTEDTLEQLSTPDTGPAGPRKTTRDCYCQSKDQKDQSCQCCECKTIGVTTSGDKETITEEEAMCKTPQEEGKTDTETEFVSISEPADALTHPSGTVEPETPWPLQRTSKPKRIRDWGIVIDDELLRKHPELSGKTSKEQQDILESLGYLTSGHRLLKALFNEYPELENKTSEEQRQFLEERGFTEDVLNQSFDEDLPENIVVAHPELLGKSKEVQKDILRRIGYPIPSEILVDQEMLKQYPQLVGMKKEDQQKMLRNLGSKQDIIVDESLLEKHPELIGKTAEEQQQILKEIGYKPSRSVKEIPIDDDILKKHPELIGKRKSEQQTILEGLGYKPSINIVVDDELLSKYPDLVGKTSQEQQNILRSLGYAPSDQPKTTEIVDDKYFTPKTASFIVDERLIQEHPELAGKSFTEQQEILKNLGYKASLPLSREVIDKPSELEGPKSEQQKDVSPGVSAQSTKRTIVDKELMEKHPELVGKTSEEQQKILETIGYPTSQLKQILVDEEMIKKHPELVGKTLEEQQRILSSLGYVSDSEQFIKEVLLEISEDIFVKHPELIGKSSEEQHKILTDLGYKIPSQDLAKSETSTKYDVGERIQLTPKSSKGPTIKSDRSLKEVSITCKAPCRSVATIYGDSEKLSKQDITIGDVSTSSVSKSRSISLQKKPSSRDDSASCKASCRTISVQSSRTKFSKNDVKEIVSARNENTTSSSSDTKEDEKSKKRPGEVPSIVSQLSDKERPIIETPKKSKSQRKKRSIRLMDCMKCSCLDPCKCEVCSPEAIERRQKLLNRPVRSCDCPPALPQMMIPPMPMAYSMPPSGHALGCTCNSCLYNASRSYRHDMGRPILEGESPTSDDNDNKKPRRHAPNCECVDCLCLPKIKKIAETREYPIIYDKKQVYQVKTKCGTCTNAQNARRYVEQQRSRIPISTSTPHPPRIKSDSKQVPGTSKIDESAKEECPADQGTPGESSTVDVKKTPIAAKLSHSDSIYNSVACDCEDCKCVDCPDPKARKSPVSDDPQTKVPKSGEPVSDKDCCCKGPCSCKPCTVEELTKKLKEAEAKLAAARAISQAPISGPELTSSPETHVEDCNCVDCTCPRSDLMQIKSPVPQTAPLKPPEGGDEEECTCPECVCPGAEQLPPKIKSTTPVSPEGKPSTIKDHPSDCSCPDCTCPGLDDYNRGKSGASKPPEAIPKPEGEKQGGGGDEECDCQVCECPGRTSLAPPEGGPIKSAPSEPVLADCDCRECRCSPCADPKKTGISPQQTLVYPEGIADCDCVDCKCSPCADPKKAKDHKVEQFESKISQMSTKEHFPDCECPTCICPGAGDVPATESKGTEVPEKIPHPPDCDCDECLCLEEIIKSEMGDKHEISDSAKHPDDCDCALCVCPGSGDVPAVESKGIDVPSKQALHPPDCDCDECKCPGLSEQGVQPPADKEIHALNCACPDCLCPECTTQVTHAPGCRCEECVCQPCSYKPIEDSKPQEHPGDCSCIKCACDVCSDPSKQPATTTTFDKPTEKGDHESGCKCVECLCKECLLKLEPLKHDEGCTCPQCTCVECLRKLARGDQPVAKRDDGKERGENCICDHCLCIDCSGKGNVPTADITTTEISSPAQDTMKPHSSDCTCEQCLCDPCTKADSKQGDICFCPKCVCDPCSKKGGLGIGALETETERPPEAAHDDSCTCTICQCKPCFKKKEEEEEPCTCPECTCIKCTKKREVGMGDKETHSPVCDCPVCKCPDSDSKPKIEKISVCDCPECKCPEPSAAQKAGGDDVGAAFLDPPPFEPPERIDCDCQKCDCIICAQKKGEKPKIRGEEEDMSEAPPFEVPIRIDCDCSRCDCIFCNKEGPKMKEVAAQPSRPLTTALVPADTKAVSAQPSKITSPGDHPIGCRCEQCTCLCDPSPVKGGVTPKESRKEAETQPSGAAIQKSSTKNIIHKTSTKNVIHKSSMKNVVSSKTMGAVSGPIHCECPTCTCNEGEIKTTVLDRESTPGTAAPSKSGGAVEIYESAATLILPKPNLDAHKVKPHPAPCDCPECKCKPCADPVIRDKVKAQSSVKEMDNITLVKSIQAANKENCECKEQIEEIKRTLEKIRCACAEAEFRSAQSIAQTMGQSMDPSSGKPFVKQASVFGQTMSGLKMALANLQSKCKAKDRMIEAMTGELEMRGTPEVFDKVLDRAMNPTFALDYDQADDVKSIDRSQLVTNVIYGPVETAEHGTAPCDLRCVASKGVEVRTHKHKKKKEKSAKAGASKKLDCSCSKPQIIQKEEKDCQKLDLAGFEVIDIRRITDDSLIVKWNAPKSDQITGYDIFVNGSLASKVMSGTRTSAMMHSLDLTKSVQITIYAVSRCGRIDPPAIAIYEIKS